MVKLLHQLIHLWHDRLDMPKHDLAWHRQDMDDELVEYREATGIINRWSELSDLVYTYTRALWTGHSDVKFPLGPLHFGLGLLYMFPKYSLRWLFYQNLARRFDKTIKIREVRNPVKTHKLDHIAKKYGLDPEKFKQEAEKLKRRWFFLK